MKNNIKISFSTHKTYLFHIIHAISFEYYRLYQRIQIAGKY